jgi:hypothetical protein
MQQYWMLLISPKMLNLGYEKLKTKRLCNRCQRSTTKARLSSMDIKLQDYIHEPKHSLRVIQSRHQQLL